MEGVIRGGVGLCDPHQRPGSGPGTPAGTLLNVVKIQQKDSRRKSTGEDARASLVHSALNF